MVDGVGVKTEQKQTDAGRAGMGSQRKMQKKRTLARFLRCGVLAAGMLSLSACGPDVQHEAGMQKREVREQEVKNKANEIVTYLAGSFYNNDKKAREDVIDALGKIAEKKADLDIAFPLLTSALRDAEVDVRVMAASALERIASRGAEIPPAVVFALENSLKDYD